MTKFDEQYLDLCRRILEQGVYAENRTGVATYKLAHQILQFDLGEEFPILTTKQVAFKTAVLEMLWIYQVQSNDTRWLNERGVKIWNEWTADAKGNYNQVGGKKLALGPEFAHTIGTAYGWIVKKYGLTQRTIKTLRENPNDRKMVMSLWQDEFMPTACLPSCVWNSQWDVTDGRLNLLVNCRSNDVPLGLPFNISQYAVLCYLLAQVCGLAPGQFTYVINNAHIYENQIEGIREQMRRAEEMPVPPAPKLWINPKVKDFFAFDNSRDLKDIKLIDYQHLGKIVMPVAT